MLKRKMKQFLSLFMAAAMLLSLLILPAGAVVKPGLADLTRDVAAEGIVMLENRNNTLPLSPDQTISVFGRMQVDTFFCGYGSGGGVQAQYGVNILDGLRLNPTIKINEDLAVVYERWCEENPAGGDGGWSGPHTQNEMPLTAEVAEKAAEQGDTAVVVLGQSAGEQSDNGLGEGGGYYRTKSEKAMLAAVNGAFDHVVVLLNMSNIVDMAWIADYENIDSVLYVWQGGMEMGNAVADVLSGGVSPSGKMSDTIALTYEDYPAKDFANNTGEKQFNNYTEDIFVGYRYFETFAPDKVMYPFGYGLSYTTFEMTAPTYTLDGDNITVGVTVTNTGDTYPGKEVVEVYHGAPQGELGKAAKSLAGYVKTNTLAPGASQTVSVTFPVNNMASYDDAGKTGHQSAWVLEAGEYPIYVGNSVRNTVVAGTYTQASTAVTEQLEEANALHANVAFQRMTTTDGKTITYEDVPTAKVDLHDRVQADVAALKVVPQTDDQGVKLVDVARGDKTMDEFVAQLTDDDLITLTSGAGGKGDSQGTPGNASVYGGVTASLKAKGVPPIATADGPSGLSLADKASLLPTGVLQACTWNDPLVEELYFLEGQEMLLNGIDGLLGPGMNIHRDPLGGRNFEYFSEDPLLSGVMAANNVKGMQHAGVSAVPKHYALNNQENNRYGTDARASERAQREIYLRAFEICIKTSKPYNLMGSYNKINGEWSHYNYEMNTTILRDDWGYEGVLMTDWWIQSDTSEKLHVRDNAYRVRSQEDVLMPGGETNTTRDSYNAWKAAGAKPGDIDSGLTLGELQRGARNVLNYVMNAGTFRAANKLENTYAEGAPWFTTAGVSQAKAPQLTSLSISGLPAFNQFTPLKKTYNVFNKDMGSIPTISATAEAGARMKIVQATAEAPIATITVTKGDIANLYRVYFSNQAGMDPVVDDPVYAKLSGITVNGKPIPAFYPTLFSYKLDTDLKSAVIEAVAPAGVTATVTKHMEDPENYYAVVRAESVHQAMEYRLNFPGLTPQPAQSDDFEGDTLNTDLWTVLNPGETPLTVADGALTVQTEQGEWFGGGNAGGGFHNVVYQAAPGNWVATVDMEFPAERDQNYRQWGIVIFDDADNNVDFGYCSAGYADGGQTIQVRQETNGSTNDKILTGEFNKIPGNEGWDGTTVTCALRVVKMGNSYTFFIKTAQTGGFTKLGSVTAALTNPKFGLFAANGNTDVSGVSVKFKDVAFEENFAKSDNFPGDALDTSIWSILNPGEKQMTVADNALTIPTEQGEWFGNGNGGGGFHNVVYQAAPGNWTATVDVEFPASSGSNAQQWGLLAYDDADHNVDVGYVSAWGAQNIQVRKEDGNGTDDGVLDKDDNQNPDGYHNLPNKENWSGIKKCSFGITKSGDTYTFLFKTGEMKDYAELCSTTIHLSNPKLGLFAADGDFDRASVDVKFSNFTVTPGGPEEPVEPESPYVPITAEGQSKIHAAEDYLYKTSKLQVESPRDNGDSTIGYGAVDEFMLFGIDVEQSGWYELRTRMASASNNQQLNFNIEVDTQTVAAFSENPTGGWDIWKTTEPKSVWLEAGEHTLRFYWRSADINLNWLSFDPVTAYAVEIDENIAHGTVSADKPAATEGETVTLSVTPDAGYKLADESLVVSKTGESGTVPVSENTFVMPACGVTVTAVFEENTDAALHTVTFLADGETVLAVEVPDGGTLARSEFPAVPEKLGHDGAWEVVDDLENITADLTVNAVYTAKTYNVTLDVNGGAELADGDLFTVTYGLPYGELPTPEYDADPVLTFDGWYTTDGSDESAPGMRIMEDSTVNVTEDHTLYARWFDEEGTSKTPDATISGMPEQVKLTEAEDIVLTVAEPAEGGTEVYTYQWALSTDDGAAWVDLDGETGSSYTIPAEDITPEMDGNQYHCTVTNTDGEKAPSTATGAAVVLRVIDDTPPVVPVESVKLDQTSVTLRVPGSVTLNATVEPADATNQDLTWSSSDESVATVDQSGLVSAVSSGKAVITATADNGRNAACLVTVKTDSESSYTPPSNTATETEKNPDGSTTKTVTNKKTGEVTETTTYPDGTKIVATTPKDGETSIEVTVPKGKETVTVTIPTAEQPKPGEVAVIVKEDGTREVVKTSVSTENGMRVTLSESCKLEIVDNSKSFADVASDHWAAEAIGFVTSRELFNGGGGGFQPAGDMSRAMLFTVLARLDGQDTTTGDTWYSAAMDWAKETGISDGTAPEASITRESLAAMLYRYAGSPEMDEGRRVKDAAPYGEFEDVDSVSDWAADAMLWAVESGIITGSDNKLNPSGTATRAEVAAMLQRFIEL